jgi:hypothetical protein
MIIIQAPRHSAGKPWPELGAVNFHILFFRLRLQTELGKTGVVIWTTTQWPMVFPVALVYGQVIDARDAPAHESMLVKLPIFVAVGTKPMAGVVMSLIGKADSNTISVKGPQLFDQAVL